MTDKKILARFTCSYELFGDVDGAAQMNVILKKAVAEKKISDYSVLLCETGVWGIQFVLFWVDIFIPPMSHENAKDLVLPDIHHIIGDTDVNILWSSEGGKS